MNQYNNDMGRGKPYPNRRSIRLKGYDYAQAGLYFITICCENRMRRFGNIENGEMILNEYGKIAHHEWVKLSERFPNFELDAFQIMPNHMHGIIVLNTVGATLAVAQNDEKNRNDEKSQNDEKNQNDEKKQNDEKNQNDIIAQNDENDIRAGVNPAPTLFDVVGAYKSLVANGCLEIYKTRNETMGKLWQRNYYEHIIRDEQSYQNISNYIINNPVNWAEDKFYSNNV